MKTLLHRINAGLLLALFSFALVAQGVHQMENPAQVVVDCENNTKHLHDGVQDHDCDLCEYQVTFWVNPVVLSQPVSTALDSYVESTQDAPLLSIPYYISLRGPPSYS